VNKKILKRFALLSLLSLLLPSSARAADWSGWWLPKAYSTHAPGIDSLFLWIFWITTITFIAVQLVLIIFLIKYRYNPNKRKAVFSHGNQRLEMFWTITPAILLLILALFSKRVWDDYRYSNLADSPDKVTVLVIGQQFKWNTIYPGPDGKLGTYLSYPKPTDTRWPDPDKWKKQAAREKAIKEGKTPPVEKPFMFKGVAGPAFLPAEAAVKAINDYNETNIQGKDFDDPNGKDDIWEPALAREIILPANRAIEVQLSSKDVIHDFFLPNFRVKLDAVPGMRGVLNFEATTTSRSLELLPENRKTYTIDELYNVMDTKEVKAMAIDVDEKSPNANYETARKAWRYVDSKKATVVRAGSSVNKASLDRLKAAGINEITLYKPGFWELVCEELCGQGHNTMRGQMRIVTSDEYDALGYDKPRATPATQPTVALSAVK
jgi:heme/copper-type cytochrome/quinol oxidase subunit 2